MTPVIRPARADEADTLKEIWKTVFCDSDEIIDAFFRHYGANDATVIQSGGGVAAAGYLLPAGSLNTPDGVRTPCAMIYSVAVLPGHRNLGLGAELTRSLIALGHASGYPAVALCPASDGLFSYYAKRTTLREWFYAREYAGYIAPGGGTLTRLTAAEYTRLRGELLSVTAHISLDERALSFQDDICGLYGGGLFSISAPGGDACAVVERDGNTVAVKELLSPGGADGATGAIARAFPAESYDVRSPVRGDGAGCARRRGMLAAYSDHAPSGGAWYGLAFD